MRWFLLLDIFGGFIMAIATGFGWYAYKEDLHITFLCYWGMMCLINGVFDLVKFIDFWAHNPMPLFDSGMPLAYNISSATLILVPLVSLPAALISWYIYQDAAEGEQGYTTNRPTEARGEAAPLRNSFRSFQA